MVSRIRIHAQATVALPYRFPQLLDSPMQGNSADRALSDRGIDNTKKKEEIERSLLSENTDDGSSIPVPPGVAEASPKK
jgi:hypothetical protein